MNNIITSLNLGVDKGRIIFVSFPTELHNDHRFWYWLNRAMTIDQSITVTDIDVIIAENTRFLHLRAAFCRLFTTCSYSGSIVGSSGS